MKMKKTMIATLLAAVCLMVGTASAGVMGDRISFHQDCFDNKFMQPEQFPLKVLAPEMMEPVIPLRYREPEGNLRRFDLNVDCKENML